MANEVQFNSAFAIKKGNVDERMYPNAFKDDITGDGKGPTPGAVTATTSGTNVDLSELTVPGYCRIRNQDEINDVHYGIWDGTEFYPFGEVGPGRHVDLKLSKYFGRSMGAAGTGTYDVGTYELQVRSENADCNVTIEAFEA